MPTHNNKMHPPRSALARRQVQELEPLRSFGGSSCRIGDSPCVRVGVNTGLCGRMATSTAMHGNGLAISQPSVRLRVVVAWVGMTRTCATHSRIFVSVCMFRMSETCTMNTVCTTLDSCVADVYHPIPGLRNDLAHCCRAKLTSRADPRCMTLQHPGFAAIKYTLTKTGAPTRRPSRALVACGRTALDSKDGWGYVQ